VDGTGAAARPPLSGFYALLTFPSYREAVKRALATAAAFVALVAAPPAQASTPVPWCGTESSAVDRLPDAVPGYAVHVTLVRPPGAPDRFAELAPRLAGDAAAIEAWWRGHDPTRSPRFDLFSAPGCAGSFGALDITSLELPQAISEIDVAFGQLRQLLGDLAFDEPEKAYLVYYDGPTGQVGNDRVCGQGGQGSFGRPALAIVFLDSCDADAGDVVRPVIAAHELMHVLGAVSSSAPSHCSRGHVCDTTSDLMAAVLSGADLSEHVLDGGRDDYYGHAGSWTDVQDSLFLERLDSPDRTPPTAPGALRVGDNPGGLTRVSWSPSQDDVGPVSYRVYEEGRFVGETTGTFTLVPGAGGTVRYAVRAADAVGHLGAVVAARYRDGVGMVDERGRLVRDTVRPPAVARVTVRRTGRISRLTWPAVRDAGGLRSYRVKIGARVVVVRKPAIAITRARVTGPVTVAAVDRAGNIGPALTVPRSRVR
jgi:hypothetical protein